MQFCPCRLRLHQEVEENFEYDVEGNKTKHTTKTDEQQYMMHCELTACAAYDTTTEKCNYKR